MTLGSTLLEVDLYKSMEAFEAGAGMATHLAH